MQKPQNDWNNHPRMQLNLFQPPRRLQSHLSQRHLSPIHPHEERGEDKVTSTKFNKLGLTERDEWNGNREKIAPPAEHLRKIKAKGVEQHVFGDEVEIDWIRSVCRYGDSRWASANASAVRAFFAVPVRD